MSDALTDIARDQQRTENFRHYLDALIDYLRNPDNERFGKVIKAAEDTDAVSGGYWGGRPSILVGLEKELGKLLKKDKVVWARQLAQAMNNYKFDKLKNLSPFKNKLLFCVTYRGDSDTGWVTRHEYDSPFKITDQVVALIVKSKKIKRLTASYFLIALPEKISGQQLRDSKTIKNNKGIEIFSFGGYGEEIKK